MTTPVSVDELQRAWAAVVAGDFRSAGTSRRRSPAHPWSPDEPCIVVAGAAGRVGATTVALGLATASGRTTRVVECGPMHTSGLAAASTAELGITASGWRQGSRGRVFIDRTTSTFQSVDEVPAPELSDCELTVLDLNWDLALIDAAACWMTPLLRSAPMIIVSVATVPGLRALENALHVTGRATTAICVLLGPPTKKWPKSLRNAPPPAVRAADVAERLFTVPLDASLGLSGLNPDPLPTPLLAACQTIFDRVIEDTKGTENHVSI